MIDKPDDHYSEEETAHRRDEVIRRMSNTPPQPRVNRPAKAQKKSAAPGRSSRKPAARKN